MGKNQSEQVRTFNVEGRKREEQRKRTILQVFIMNYLRLYTLHIEEVDMNKKSNVS